MTKEELRQEALTQINEALDGIEEEHGLIFGRRLTGDIKIITED